MSWLAWAVDDPALGNCGYSILNVPCEVSRSLRRGLVLHSVEGWFTHVNPSAVMRARGNSWGVTIMRNGQVWRHRPRPTFVNWHAGGPEQNIGTDGIEMEGKDQPWTPEQRASLLRVLKETWDWFGWSAVALAQPTDRTQEGIRQALLARGYGSLWEHRWFDFTSCPSDRDDWPWLMPALEEEEDDMATPEEIRSTARALHRVLTTGRVTSGLIGPGGDRDDLGGWPDDQEAGVTLQAILDAINGISGGGGVQVSDAQLTRVLTPIVRKALKDMAKKAGA